MATFTVFSASGQSVANLYASFNGANVTNVLSSPFDTNSYWIEITNGSTVTYVRYNGFNMHYVGFGAWHRPDQGTYSSIDITDDAGNVLATLSNLPGLNQLAGEIFNEPLATVLSAGDTFNGGAGNDTLIGYNGINTFIGGGGADTMIGSGHFVLRENDQPGDIIDASAGSDDTIVATGGAVSDLILNLSISTTVTGIERLEFAQDGGGAGSNAYHAIIDKSQLGAGFASNLHLIGRSAVTGSDRLWINFLSDGTLDLSGFTFENWGGDDNVTIDLENNRTATLIGTSQRDVVAIQATSPQFGSGIAVDTGLGDDEVHVTIGASAPFTNVALAGGGHFDRLTVATTTGELLTDASGWNLSGFEELFLGYSSGGGLNLAASQLASGFSSTLAVRGDAGQQNLQFTMGTQAALNLSGLTFTNWTDAEGDRTTIVGDDSAETIVGTSRNDLIIGGGGADSLSGGDGNDTIRFHGSQVSFLTWRPTLVSGGAGTNTLELEFDPLGRTYDFRAIDFSGFQRITAFGTPLPSFNVIGASFSRDAFPSQPGLQFNIGNGLDFRLSFAGSNGGLLDLSTTSATLGVGANLAFQIFETPFVADTTIGSNFSDTSYVGSGDTVRLGQGADALWVYTDEPFQPVETLAAGTVLDGQAGHDQLWFQNTADGLTHDVRLATILSVEEVFLANSSTNAHVVQLSSAQFGGGGIASNAVFRADAYGTLAAETVEIFATTGGGAFSMAGITFGSWEDGNDKFVFRGSGVVDTVTGSLKVDHLYGNNGNDAFEGGGGNDLIDGGDGTDEARYSAATNRVIVNLAAASNQAIGGAEVGTDQLVGIENVTGGAGHDILTGNSGANRLAGGGGGDYIIGGGGVDQLLGDAGDDTIVYDPNDDLANVLGGANTDTLIVSNMAVPLSFDLAAHQFEIGRVEQTDTSGQPWTSYYRLYAPGWVQTQQFTVYDNGTSIRQGFDSAGRLDWQQEFRDIGGTNLAIYTDFDQVPGSSNTWTTQVAYYAADGVTRTQQFVTYDNGTSIRQGYDSAGRLDWQQEFRDIGGTNLAIYTDFDQMPGSGNSWTQQVAYYAADGMTRTQQFVTYDNGKSIRQGYDAQGRLDWMQEFRNIDGTSLEFYTEFDQADQFPTWFRYVDAYALDGTTILSRTYYDEFGNVV